MAGILMSKKPERTLWSCPTVDGVGLAHLQKVREENDELQVWKRTLLHKMSVIMEKNGNFKDTISLCTEGSQEDPKNIKAFYLR
jgi:hypothetical protein